MQDSGNRVDPVRRYTFSLRPLWLESEREVAFERKNPLCRPIWGTAKRAQSEQRLFHRH